MEMVRIGVVFSGYLVGIQQRCHGQLRAGLLKDETLVDGRHCLEGSRSWLMDPNIVFMKYIPSIYCLDWVYSGANGWVPVLVSTCLPCALQQISSKFANSYYKLDHVSSDRVHVNGDNR